MCTDIWVEDIIITIMDVTTIMDQDTTVTTEADIIIAEIIRATITTEAAITAEITAIRDRDITTAPALLTLRAAIAHRGAEA
jgi:hypothetical protein